MEREDSYRVVRYIPLRFCRGGRPWPDRGDRIFFLFFLSFFLFFFARTDGEGWNDLEELNEVKQGPCGIVMTTGS